MSEERAAGASRQEAELRRILAEHDKLAVERDKLFAEQLKLVVEREKLSRERALAPWALAVGGVGAGAALFAAAFAFARLFA